MCHATEAATAAASQQQHRHQQHQHDHTDMRHASCLKKGAAAS